MNFFRLIFVPSLGCLKFIAIMGLLAAISHDPNRWSWFSAILVTVGSIYIWWVIAISLVLLAAWFSKRSKNENLSRTS